MGGGIAVTAALVLPMAAVLIAVLVLRAWGDDLGAPEWVTRHLSGATQVWSRAAVLLVGAAQPPAEGEADRACDHETHEHLTHEVAHLSPPPP